MMEFIDKAKRYLWAFVEIGFLVVLSAVLIFLIMGENSGVFITSVAQNVIKFAGDVPPQSLVGIAIVLALVLLLTNRMRRE